ncbi:MAG: hypothetical protein KUG78_19225 [Kangiellaceae bacterium]|nr:hypothetical protein [Kangiellaceae bacterium]
MLNLFNRTQSLLDEEIIEWIFNCYAWTLDQFDKNVFLNEAVLVIPDNSHFPGKETSADGMANLIFDQVKQFAGMSHWPTRLYNLATSNGMVPVNQSIIIDGALRGKNANMQSWHSTAIQGGNPQSELFVSSYPQPIKSINFSFHPQQLKSPEGIIAHFAHGLSQHLAGTAKILPPGGINYLPMAGELTGIFMGFGIMFSNSAVIARAGGCGGGQSPVRQVILSEEEATYALAVFCHLKSIDGRSATKHLKKHLRPFYKASIKDCKLRLKERRDLKLT